MSKKLVSLIVILALAGFASAANNQWQGPSGGNWHGSTSYWSLGYFPSVASGDAAIVRRADGTASNVVVTWAADGGTKVRMEFGAGTTLTINSGGSLITRGSVDNYNVSNTITINSGGRFLAATSGGSFKVAHNTAVAANTDLVDVYGLLRIKGDAAGTTGILAITADSRAGVTPTNTGTVNLYGTGVLLVDAYTIGTYGAGSINIATGGQMQIKGNALAQVNADILAGRIAPLSGATLIANYDLGTNTTYVPEPATVALLGLGSLMLLRRKR